MIWSYLRLQEKCEATQRENQMLRSDMQVLEEKLAEKRAEINKEEKASNKPTASKVQGSETERRAGNEVMCIVHLSFLLIYSNLLLTSMCISISHSHPCSTIAHRVQQV